MSEIKRVALSPKMIVFLAIALILNCFFIAYECVDDRQITLQGEELERYIESYPEYLKGINESADSLDNIAILNGKGSFSSRNIRKTVEDYSRLSGKIVSGENRGIVVISNYITSDLILVVLIIYVVICYTEERKKGLYYLVYSTKNGRLRLALWRLGIVTAMSVLVSIMLMLTEIITVTAAYGDMGLMRPIQSVPEFMKCSYSMTVLEYFIASALLKAAAAMLMGTLFYLFFVLFKSAAAVIVTALVMGVQYILHAVIIPTASVNVLKYCNTFALLRCDVFFKNYCNLNIIGKPVGFLKMAILFSIFFIVVQYILCALLACGKVSLSTSGIGLIDSIHEKLSRHAPNLTITMWEAKKTLINQKGILIIAAAVILTVTSVTKYAYMGSVDEDYEKLYKRYSGVVTGELVDVVTKDRDRLDKNVKAMIERYKQMINDGEPEEKLLEMFGKLSDENYWLILTNEMLDKAVDCLVYTEKSGMEVELINQKTYETLLSSDNAISGSNLYILLALIATFGGIMAWEKQNNMSFTLKSLNKGRGRLVISKVIVLFVVCAVLSLSVNIAQLIHMSKTMELNNISAPCQSIIMLRNIPFKVSIREYLMILYSLRVMCTFVIGLFVMFISSRCSSKLVAIDACAVLLLLPSVLNAVGLKIIPSATDFIGIVPR